MFILLTISKTLHTHSSFILTIFLLWNGVLGDKIYQQLIKVQNCIMYNSFLDLYSLFCLMMLNNDKLKFLVTFKHPYNWQGYLNIFNLWIGKIWCYHIVLYLLSSRVGDKWTRIADIRHRVKHYLSGSRPILL